MRTPLGGCEIGFGGCQIRPKDTFEVKPNQVGVPLDITAHANTALLDVLRKVKALRDAQNLHAKTMNYGYRCRAIRLGKEVDEMLDKLKIE